MKSYDKILIILLGILFPNCQDSQVEDDCGECWDPYCYYFYDGHTIDYSVSQDECEANNGWWIGPGGAYEPGDYEFCLFDDTWNASCTGCVDLEACNFDANALIGCDNNCNGEVNDCCIYEGEECLSNNLYDSYPFNIEGVYPNPFNPTTTIAISLSNLDEVNIFVYDLDGKLVYKVFQGFLNQGNHEFELDASNLSSGSYITVLSNSDRKVTQLISLIK